MFLYKSELINTDIVKVRVDDENENYYILDEGKAIYTTVRKDKMATTYAVYGMTFDEVKKKRTELFDEQIGYHQRQLNGLEKRKREFIRNNKEN